jgi:hypothetical protein
MGSGYRRVLRVCSTRIGICPRKLRILMGQYDFVSELQVLFSNQGVGDVCTFIRR